MRIVKGTQTKLHGLAALPALLLLVVLAGGTAKADPLSFSNVTAFQNNNTVQVDLFSNPGTTLFGSNLTFSADITGTLPPGVVDTLRITFTQAGSAPIVQDFGIPAFGTIQPPFTVIFSVVAPQINLQGVPATLTLDLLNSSPDFVVPGGQNQGQSVNSFTFSFNVAQPVPEPATLFVLATGLTALGVRFRRRPD